MMGGMGGMGMMGMGMGGGSLVRREDNLELDDDELVEAGCGQGKGDDSTSTQIHYIFSVAKYVH